MNSNANRQRGFSLLEMLVVVAVFSVITGAVFVLLDVSQKRYKMESEILATFQDARLGMDQLTRDVHSSGYPPANQFTPAIVAANPDRFAMPFAFSPNYPAGCNGPFQIGVGACRTPSEWDLIVEAEVNQQLAGIEWVRYRLNGRTLERGFATKTVGADPAAATLAVGGGWGMAPFVDNVINNTTAAEIVELQGFYPGLFPGNAPVPVFTYLCQIGTGPIGACTAANLPQHIREVNITLIVRSPSRDPQTQQPRVMTLTGRARRVNPSS